MTGGDTRLASAAFIEVNFEGVLLTGGGGGGGEEFCVTSPTDFVRFMRAGKFLDRRELTLLREQRVNQRVRFTRLRAVR